MSKEIPNEWPEQQKKEQIDVQTVREDIQKGILPKLVNNVHSRRILESFLWGSQQNGDTAKLLIRESLQKNKKYKDIYLGSYKIIVEAIDKNSILKQMIAPILAERKKIENNLLEVAEKWFDFQQPKLDDIRKAIENIASYDIRQMTFSPKKLKNFLLTLKNFSDADFQVKDIGDFLKDFSLDINDFTKDEQDIIENYVQHKKVDVELLELLIAKTKNDDIKKNIIKKILGTVSFDVLVHQNILNKSEQDAIIQQIFEKSFDDATKKQLTAEEKIFILWEIREDLFRKKYSLSIEDIHPDKITKKILESSAMRQNFEKILAEYISINEDAEEKEKENLQNLDAVKNFLKETLKDAEKKKISGKDANDIDLWSSDAIDSLSIGSHIRMKNQHWQATIWRIDEAINGGKIRFTRLEIRENPITNTYDWTETKKYAMSYKEFVDGIIHNLRDSEITDMEIFPNPPPNLTLETALEFANFDAFHNELDAIDSSQPRKRFEENSIFTLSFSADWEQKLEYVRVTNIDTANQVLTIRAYDWAETTLSWATFLSGVSASGHFFHRLGKLDTLQDFADNAYISKEVRKEKNAAVLVNAIQPDLILNNGAISIKVKEQDNAVAPVWGFKHPKKPAFIEVLFRDGRPIITEIVYTSDKEEMLAGNPEVKEPKSPRAKKKFKESMMKKKKRVNKRIGEGIHNYEWLLQLMHEKEYTKPVHSVDKKGKIGNDITPTEQYEQELQEQEDNELNGGNMTMKNRWFFWVLSGMTTIGDLMTMGKMTKNAIEQYFEKHGKLRASESLHKMFSIFGEDTPLAQLALKEFANEVGGLIEGKMDMIRRLKGGKMRAEIKKILRTRPPEPVDILAAAMVTAEMWGHMYPDSILMDLQWDRYYWFEAICLAIGLNPHSQLRIIKDKVGEKNPESAHHPSESELITQLFKANQSNKYVQAINGGSKFWKKPEEWRSAQKDKWGKEAKEFSSAGARAGYAIAKMESNEFEVALGAIGPVAGKSMWPQEMGIGFVWAASNAPNYVHHSTGNELRNVFYEGNSFHGFFFGKEKEGADLYKDIIDIALERRKNLGLPGADAMYTQYKKITSGRDSSPYSHDENLIKGLWKFWQEHYATLHPILQGTDPLLGTIIEDDTQDPGDKQRIMDYLNMFEENMKVAFGEDLKDGLKWNFKSMNATYQADNSFLLFSDGNLPYRSFKPLLSSLSFDSTTQEMSGADRNGIWSSIILDYLKKYLRDGETFNDNPDFQRKQYLLLYKEIMSKLSEKMSRLTREAYETGLERGSFKHIPMLESVIGTKIEYDFLFAEWDQKARWITELNQNPDLVFARFKNSGGMSGSERVQQNIQNRFGKAIKFWASDS